MNLTMSNALLYVHTKEEGQIELKQINLINSTSISLVLTAIIIKHRFDL